MIAEDNEINQLVVGEILRSQHLQCTIVSNGQEALEAVRARPYDAVLMDCEMPEMDGFTATREIRKLEDSGQLAARGKKRLPIIALTAHVDEGYRHKCLSAGMDDFVSKPIDSEGFLRRSSAGFAPVEVTEQLRRAKLARAPAGPPPKVH